MFKFKQQRRTAVIILAFIALLSGLITGRDILFSLAYLLSLLLIISFACSLGKHQLRPHFPRYSYPAGAGGTAVGRTIHRPQHQPHPQTVAGSA